MKQAIFPFSGGVTGVTLEPVTDASLASVLKLVSNEHPMFSRYYECPKPGTTVCVVRDSEEMVGALLLERKPDAAESADDGALACVIIAERLRGNGLGSAAIGAAASTLVQQGCKRVIAEWVASVTLYERLGFKVWKRRMIEPK